MKTTLATLSAALLLTLTPTVEAGLFSKGCDSNGSCDTCCEDSSCNPDNYRCKLEVKSEKVSKSCYKVEAKPICVPPITTSPFDCLKKKLCGNGGCDDCCDAGCTGCDSCDGAGCGSGHKGLFSCFKKNCGTIKCVNKLSKDKQDAGEECVCKWSAEYVGPCCGDGCCNGNGCDNGGCCETPCSPLR